MAKKKSSVNKAGNYTKPGMRKRMFNTIMAGSKGGKPGQWSARKAQLLALRYKKAGGGYKSIKAPKGFHWMKSKNGLNLMKHTGAFKKHPGASLTAKFTVQKRHGS